MGQEEGVTAEKLGISRRTLSRKLKRYGSGSPQQGEAESLGVLSPKQKNCFRAAVRTPVVIRNQRGEELACEIANVPGIFRGNSLSLRYQYVSGTPT